MAFIDETLSGIAPISHPYGSEPVMPTGTFFYKQMVDIPVWTGLSDEKRMQLLNGSDTLQEHKHMKHLFGAEYEILFTDKPMDLQTGWLFNKVEEMLVGSYSRLTRLLEDHPTTELCPDCSVLKIKALLGHKLLWKLFHILCDDCYQHMILKFSGKYDEVKKQDHDKKLDMQKIESMLRFQKKANISQMIQLYYNRCKNLLDIARKQHEKDGQYFNFHDPLADLRLIIAGMDDLYNLILALLEGCAI